MKRSNNAMSACACAPGCHGRERAEPLRQTTRVRLALHDASRTVDSEELPWAMLAGERVVRLGHVWLASQLAADLSTLMFDFVGDDGFSPSIKRGTHLLGSALLRGYMEVETRRLRWEASLDLPCFYSVKGVATIVAERRFEDALTIPRRAPRAIQLESRSR